MSPGRPVVAFQADARSTTFPYSSEDKLFRVPNRQVITVGKRMLSDARCSHHKDMG